MAPYDDTRVEGSQSMDPEAALDSAAEQLSEFWMDISDHRAKMAGRARAILAETTALSPFRDFAAAVHTSMASMDELIFKSIEAMDDLLTLLRTHHAAPTKQPSATTVSTASASTPTLPMTSSDPPGQGLSTVEILQVMQRSHTQSVVGSSTADAFTTPLTTPTAHRHKRPLSPDVEVQRAKRLHHAKPSTLLTSVRSIDASAKKKRSHHHATPMRSPATPDSTETKRSPYTKSSKRVEYKRIPWGELEHLQPVKVTDSRIRGSQKEFLTHYAGRDQPIWLSQRKMPPDVRRLVTEFISTQRQLKVEHSASDASTPADSSSQDTSDVYIVESIVKHRISKTGKKQYWVKWDGYATEDNTWEPAVKLRAEVPEIVDEYERQQAKNAARSDKARHSTALLSQAASPSVPTGKLAFKIDETMKNVLTNNARSSAAPTTWQQVKPEAASGTTYQVEREPAKKTTGLASALEDPYNSDASIPGKLQAGRQIGDLFGSYESDDDDERYSEDESDSSDDRGFGKGLSRPRFFDWFD